MSKLSIVLAVLIVVVGNACFAGFGLGKFKKLTASKSEKASSISDDEIFNGYSDILNDKLKAQELLAEALGMKEGVSERLASVRTSLKGGLTEDNLASVMNVNSEVTVELLKVVSENKPLRAGAKKNFKKGLLKSRKSGAKEWLLNIKIAKAWKEVITGLVRNKNLAAARKAKAEADKFKKRKPLFRALRAASKESREANKKFVTYAESQKITIKKDSSDELPDMIEVDME